ncbi:MAG: RidA family protein [Solirubrobacterales bacterium]|nr:RidA family protein [Solirubrobacterales bacterium]MBV9533906.1 RidA family protein [Solirubrobacterales bacterium]
MRFPVDFGLNPHQDLPAEGGTTCSEGQSTLWIGPSSWASTRAQLIEGHERQLICSGQDAVDANGNPQHPGDMAAQIEVALGNLEAILAAANMTLDNVVRQTRTRPTSTSCSSTGQP